MKTIYSYLLLYSLSLNLLNAQTIISTHPRILLEPSTITNLQSRATANTIEWQEIEIRLAAIAGMNSSQIMNVVYEGQHYSFYHALNFYATGNTSSRDSAVSLFEEYFYNYTADSTMYFDSGYESRSTLVDVAILYDWLYNYMSPTFRSDVRTRIILWANWIQYQPNIYGIWNGPYFFEGNNYTMGHLAGITAAGYSIQSEDATNGNRLITVSDSIMPIMMNFVNTRLNNGDANEGWGYGAGYALSFFKTLSIIKTATTAHINLYDSTDYDEGIAKFLPFASLPNLTHMLAEGDWARESTGEIWDYHRIVADILSSYSNDLTTQRICRFWANETVPISTFDVTSYRWFPFLFSNQEITPLDYRTVSPYTNNYLYTDTTGTDQFIQRTGWAASSQWISYRGGGRYGDHAHNGAGHFSLYENGWLLIDKNIQSASGIEGMDSVHNCTQVETMDNIEMYPFANDYNLAEHTFEKRMEVAPSYSYFWSNTAPIYLERETYNMGELNVVTQKERQFFYLPQIKKIAIFDMVETELSSQSKWFATHFVSPPTMGVTGNYVYCSNDSTTAYVTTCYPQNPAINIYGNSARTNNPTSQSKDHFMHLIHTQQVGTPLINIISVNQEEANLEYSNFYGSFHEDVANNYVLLFNGNDQTYTFDSVSYRVPVTDPGLENYLIGVTPSHNYYVKYILLPGEIKITVYNNNTAGATNYTSSGEGVLHFQLGSLPVSMPPTENMYANIFLNYYNSSIEIHSIENMGDITFGLIDQLGKTLMTEKLFADKYISIPVENISSGIYIVNLYTKKGSINKKVFIAE